MENVLALGLDCPPFAVLAFIPISSHECVSECSGYWVDDSRAALSALTPNFSSLLLLLLRLFLRQDSCCCSTPPLPEARKHARTQSALLDYKEHFLLLFASAVLTHPLPRLVSRFVFALIKQEIPLLKSERRNFSPLASASQRDTYATEHTDRKKKSTLQKTKHDKISRLSRTEHKKKSDDEIYIIETRTSPRLPKSNFFTLRSTRLQQAALPLDPPDVVWSLLLLEMRFTKDS